MKFLTTLCLLALYQVTLADLDGIPTVSRWFETSVTEATFAKVEEERGFIRHAFIPAYHKLVKEGYYVDEKAQGYWQNSKFRRKCMIYAEHCPQDVVDQLKAADDIAAREDPDLVDREDPDFKFSWSVSGAGYKTYCHGKLTLDATTAILKSKRFNDMRQFWWMPFRHNLNLSQETTVNQWHSVMKKLNDVIVLEPKNQTMKNLTHLLVLEPEIEIDEEKGNEAVIHQGHLTVRVRVHNYSFYKNQGRFGNHKGTQDKFEIEIVSGAKDLLELSAVTEGGKSSPTKLRKVLVRVLHRLHPDHVPTAENALNNWKYSAFQFRPENIEDGAKFKMEKFDGPVKGQIDMSKEI